MFTFFCSHSIEITSWKSPSECSMESLSTFLISHFQFFCSFFTLNDFYITTETEECVLKYFRLQSNLQNILVDNKIKIIGKKITPSYFDCLQKFIKNSRIWLFFAHYWECKHSKASIICHSSNCNFLLTISPQKIILTLQMRGKVTVKKSKKITD